MNTPFQQPPKSGMSTGAKIGIGCAIAFAAFIALGIMGAIIGGVSESAKPSVKVDNSVSTQGAKSAPEVEKPEPPKEDFIISDVTTRTEDYSRCIVGSVKNNTGHDCSYAQIEFNLYDAEGNQLDSTMDNINNFEAGSVWKFSAIIIDDKVRSYKLVGVSGM